jgi:iron-sulfur cluster assembly protein
MEDLRVTLHAGETLLHRLLKKGVQIAHDCGGKLACSSCRVVVRRGLESLDAASEDEIDMLDRAGGAAAGARLACQVSGPGELVLEIESTDVPRTSVVGPVAVTRLAAKHLSSQLVKHPGAIGVRLSVERSGCSGFGYRVDPALAVGNDDNVFEGEGVRILVDAVSLPYLQGTTLDLVRDRLAARLRFDNPNARQSCGCGDSFGV